MLSTTDESDLLGSEDHLFTVGQLWRVAMLTRHVLSCLPGRELGLTQVTEISSQSHRLTCHINNALKYNVITARAARWAVFSSVRLRVCMWVCSFVNTVTWTVWDITMKFLREQDMVKSPEEIEKGCIPMLCLVSDILVRSLCLYF